MVKPLQKHESQNFVDDRHVSTVSCTVSTASCIDTCRFQPAKQIEDASSSAKMFKEICSHFGQVISEGSNYVCTGCTQTFFRQSVLNLANLKRNELKTRQFLSDIKSMDCLEWICKTSWKSIKVGKMPKNVYFKWP